MEFDLVTLYFVKDADGEIVSQYYTNYAHPAEEAEEIGGTVWEVKATFDLSEAEVSN